MRFRASPLMVAVALGLVNSSVLSAEAPSRSRASRVAETTPSPAATTGVDRRQSGERDNKEEGTAQEG